MIAKGKTRTAVFDAIAPQYDAVFTESRIGRAQRRAVWEVLDRSFAAGERVLEINCGTGADALDLAGRGVRVLACDVSRGMIGVARRRARDLRCSGAEFEVRAIEELGGLSGRFDGLLSNFGGLNCIADLASFGRNADRLLRPGALLVLCYMSALCAWETLWYAVQGKFAKSSRRWKRRNVAASLGPGIDLRIQYPTVAEIARALGPRFRLRERKGIGIFVPPSYLERVAAHVPRALTFAERIDNRVAHWPLLRALADHTLLRFEKVA